MKKKWSNDMKNLENFVKLVSQSHASPQKQNCIFGPRNKVRGFENFVFKSELWVEKSVKNLF